MAKVLGINAVFHDPSAAVVVDGHVVSAAEEERFSRRKHGKTPLPFAAWELPEQAARWCLQKAGLKAEDLDAVAYSYDPRLADPHAGDVTADGWEALRNMYASLAPQFLAEMLPGLDPLRVRFVRHHVAHAASAHLAAPFKDSAVLVLDGAGEKTSHLAGLARGGGLEILASQALPHSLGLMYEYVTEHLGFRRSSDEYKVMAMASYGTPRFLGDLRRLIGPTGDGGFHVDHIDWAQYAPGRRSGQPIDQVHFDLAASVQVRLQEVLLSLARWLHSHTLQSNLTMAGGVALNCVANSYLAEQGPFRKIWVQPAAGDAGTALGAALFLATELGDDVKGMSTAALGRSWSESEIRTWLDVASVPYEESRDIAGAVARLLADNHIVAWFQGRSEFGPRALGHRSLLANPTYPENLQRLNNVKGREQFRPVAPMVLENHAAAIFEGPLPSPYMLFTHRVRPEWREKIAASVHVDGTARIQTISSEDEPLVAQMLEKFYGLTGIPVVINTSYNTAGRPMVDDPRDALEAFGSAAIDALAVGPFLVKRNRTL
ncbi:carbamoyltransferase family protein [Micromonospora sp. DT44]|uniref:carbamoyltransferase family protein n=1 Tax=Micromonospora sp. DT44 TaxID=3393439 RepID=UPI003CECA79D